MKNYERRRRAKKKEMAVSLPISLVERSGPVTSLPVSLPISAYECATVSSLDMLFRRLQICTSLKVKGLYFLCVLN